LRCPVIARRFLTARKMPLQFSPRRCCRVRLSPAHRFQAPIIQSAEHSGRYSNTKKAPPSSLASESILRARQISLKSSAAFLLCFKSDQIQSNLRRKIRFERNLLRQRFTGLFFFIVIVVVSISVV